MHPDSARWHDSTDGCGSVADTAVSRGGARPLTRRMAVLAFVCGAAAMAASGCGPKYSRLDPASARFAEALFTACNTRRADTLQKIVQQLDEQRGVGTIPERDYEAFLSIIEIGRSGEWEKAEAEARRLIEDQTVR